MMWCTIIGAVACGVAMRVTERLMWRVLFAVLSGGLWIASFALFAVRVGQ